ncbi:MAG TPA: reverse transcriptase family protein, partial [Aquella sp.]|nr:reverse transcriptase family protein [Aquella sp.]
MRKKKLFCFFIDFKAAFDSIPWDALFYKLYRLGFSDKIVKLLSGLYSGSSCSVKLKEGQTKSFLVNVGVKQGCLLSPLLFALYINDMEDSFDIENGFDFNENTRISLLKYADDIVMLTSDPQDLRNMIFKLEKYCDEWNLTLNLKKSKVMVFDQNIKSKNHKFIFKYKNEVIEIVDEYKYLGMLLNSKNTLNAHLKIKLNKAKSAIVQVYRNLMYAKVCKLEPKIRLFNSIARVIVNYGAQYWGYMEFEETEKLVRFFIKQTFYLPTNTPNYAVLGETGLEPNYVCTLKLHLNYIKKTLRVDKDRYIYKSSIITMDRNLGWAKKFRGILITLGVIKNREMLTKELFMDNFKLVMDHCSSSWKNEFTLKVKNAQKHLLYKHLFGDFNSKKS